MAAEEAAHLDAFHDLLYLLLFLIAAWAAGKVATRLGAPALCGEIILGALMGPPVGDVVPHPEALRLVGEVGLVLMVVEAGLEVQPAMLKQVGLRSVAVAFAGSIFGPLLIALGFTVAFGCGVTEGLAAGVALSPTSMGAALVVLKGARALNTPTGQLIVAAAVIDDVIALVLLSELRALAEPSVAAFVIPIVSAVAFTLGVGAAALYAVPPLLTRILLPRLSAEYVEQAILLLLMGTSVGLMAACNAGRASHLLGAFLGGLCFCSLHSLHRLWTGQVKRLQTWTVRVFFAATVGFVVPLQRFSTGAVWGRGMLYTATLVGKLATGLLAKPLTLTEALTVGTAMCAWGELAFVVALTSRNELGLMSEDTYAAIMLAVLISVVVGPTSLRAVLAWEARRTAAALAAANAATRRGVVYYKLALRGVNRFGLMPDLLRLLGSDGVEVLDCRVDSQAGGQLALVEAYLKDTRLADANPETRLAAGLAERLTHLRARLLGELLAHDSQAALADTSCEEAEEGYAGTGETVDWTALRGLSLRRWMPGAAPEEWAAAGLEGAEETAMTLMLNETERNRALRHVRFSPPDTMGDEEDAAAAGNGIHDADADARPSTPRLLRVASAVLAHSQDDAVAADRAVAAAAALAEDERALRAHEAEGHGLMGAVRHAPPPGLEALEPAASDRLARARSVRLVRLQSGVDGGGHAGSADFAAAVTAFRAGMGPSA